MKIKLFYLCLIFLLFTFFGAASAAAQAKVKQNAVEQKLKALIKQAIEAQANFDAATLERIYASDYVEISPVGEVSNLRD